jgi:phage shock protein E
MAVTMNTTQAVLVDVRSPAEFASGHVQGAVNLPLDRLASDALTVLPDKSVLLVLYCISGARSEMAAQWLRQAGYTQVTNGLSAGSVALQSGRSIHRA